MTLEEFKQKLREYLIKQVGEKEADHLLTVRKDSWEDCYKQDWLPEATGAGMVLGVV